MAELTILSLSGVAILLADFLKLRRLMLYIAIAAIAGAGLFCFTRLGYDEVVYNMASLDRFSRPFLLVLCIVGVLWFWGFRSFFGTTSKATDFYALLLFSFAGAACLVSYTNLSMLFIGIEVLSIPIYVMAGSRRTDALSNESAFKYFLMGSFASGFLLLGITLIYGATGTFDLSAIAGQQGTLSPDNQGLLLAGFVLTIAAFCFKISAVPFHFWSSDVYQGSPTPVTAFMATVVKIASFAALMKFMWAFEGSISKMTSLVIYTICMLTMLVANTAAAAQTNVKRLFAFSSISHSGFMLTGIYAQQSGSYDTLVFYSLVYGIASLVSFRALWLLNDEHAVINDFKGFLKKQPLAGVALILSLLSMAGIPPLSGFLAKYMVLANALAAGHPWLVLVGIVSSLVAIYYYFKIIVVMTKEGDSEAAPALGMGDRLFFIVGCLLLVGLGVFPMI